MADMTTLPWEIDEQAEKDQEVLPKKNGVTPLDDATDGGGLTVDSTIPRPGTSGTEHDPSTDPMTLHLKGTEDTEEDVATKEPEIPPPPPLVSTEKKDPSDDPLAGPLDKKDVEDSFTPSIGTGEWAPGDPLPKDVPFKEMTEEQQRIYLNTRELPSKRPKISWTHGTGDITYPENTSQDVIHKVEVFTEPGVGLIDKFKEYKTGLNIDSAAEFEKTLGGLIDSFNLAEEEGPTYSGFPLVQQPYTDINLGQTYSVWGYFQTDDNDPPGIDFIWTPNTNQAGSTWARMIEQNNLYRRMRANLASDMSMADKKAAIEADMMAIGQALGIERDQLQMAFAADIRKEEETRALDRRNAEIHLDFIQKLGGTVPDNKDLYGNLAGETFEGTLAEGQKQQAIQDYIRAKMEIGGEVPNRPEFGMLAGMTFEGEKAKREAQEGFVTDERKAKEAQQNLNAELSIVLKSGGTIPKGFGTLSGKKVGPGGEIESDQDYQARLLKEGREGDKTSREELAELQSELDKSETVDAALLMHFLRRGGTIPDDRENREKYGGLAGVGFEKTPTGDDLIRIKGTDQTDQDFQEQMLENRQKFEQKEAATARTEESEQQRASQFINSVLETGTQTIPGTGIDIPIGYVQKNGQVVPSLDEERGRELYGDFYGLVVPGRQKWQQQQDHVAWERDWKMQAAKLGLAGSNTDEQLADAVRQKEEADSLDRANFALTIIKQMSENPVFLRYLRDSPLLSQLSQDTGYDFTWISSGGADPAILGEASLPHFADWQALPPDRQSLVLSDLSVQLGVKPADIRSEIVRRASGMGLAFGNRGVAPSRLALGWT